MAECPRRIRIHTASILINLGQRTFYDFAGACIQIQFHQFDLFQCVLTCFVSIYNSQQLGRRIFLTGIGVLFLQSVKSEEDSSIYQIKALRALYLIKYNFIIFSLNNHSVPLVGSETSL